MFELEPIDGVDLDHFLRATARVEHAPGDSSAVLASLALPDADAWRRVDQGWRQRMEADAQLGEVAGQFIANYIREARGEPLDDDGEGGDHEPREPAPAELQPVQQVPSFMQHREAPSLALPPSMQLVQPPIQPQQLTPPPVAPPRFGTPPALAPAAPPAFQTSLDHERLRGILASTPFVGKTSPERLQVLREKPVEEQTPLQKPASRRTIDTMMFSPPGLERVARSTLPFARGGARATYPDLSLDQYAAFAAEVHAKGASSVVLARYGIDSWQAMIDLHAEQERRFAADPALRARFEERKAHFISFMKPAK